MKFVFNSFWKIINRLKIHFLLIFFLMNYTFLRKFGYKGETIELLIAFTFLNFSLHMFNNYFDSVEDEKTGQSEFLKSESVLLILGLLSFVISLGMVFYFGFSFLCFVIIFLIGMSYNVPLGKRRFRIKNVLYLKNITGSLFWWYIPFVLISAIHTGSSIFHVFMSSLMTLAVFMPFEPLWDIKDMDGDKAAGIVTIPNKFGVQTTKLLVFISFLLLLIVKLSRYDYKSLLFFVPLLFFTYIIDKDSPLYYSQLMMFFLPSYIFIRILTS